MITNKNLYEMIAKQIDNGNEELRNQLKNQITEKTSQTQSLFQQLIVRQSADINDLSVVIKERLDSLYNELNSKILESVEKNKNNLHSTSTEISELYVAELENLRKEIDLKIDESNNNIIQMINVVNDHLINLQKDTAVIMETLQLVLTNMMLDNIGNTKDKET